VDHGVIELYYHSVPMSCQQVYHLLDQVNFPLEHYQVYSYLRRFGYIVMRTIVYDEDEDSDDDNNENNKNNNMHVDSTANNVNNNTENNNNVNNNTSGDDIMKDNEVEQKEDGEEDEEELPTIETANNNSKSANNDAFWKKIQLIGPASSERIEKLSEKPANKTPFKIHYDVYKPSKRQNFRKTNPGAPSFRISICKFNETPPSIRELEELSLLSHPVPVKFCVVNEGVINFLGMQPIVTDMILN
jgi:hypothetical protein